MKVFISWSGDFSHRIALSLRDWLPAVLPFVKPWVSSEDTPRGTWGGVKLASELEGTHSGIVCIVPGNVIEARLNFEAGALSQSIAATRLHPFLVGVEPDELFGPLTQFNATCYSKDDMRKLIHALNSEAVESGLPTEKVDRSFNICWPNLENRLRLLLLDPLTSRTPMPGNEARRL